MILRKLILNNMFSVITLSIRLLLTIGRSEGWWVDIDTSHHVCYDRAMFKIYTIDEDKKVLLGDSHTTNIARTIDMELEFTSERNLFLNDVMRISDIRKHLVFSILTMNNVLVFEK
ncbi:hypothetical protein Lal_00021286, partial [Lupinus albus]